MRLLSVLLVCMLACHSAAAETLECRMMQGGNERVVAYDDLSELAERETTREWALYWTADIWHSAWGEPPWCPSPILIDQLKEAAGFSKDSQACLFWSEQGEWTVRLGEPNFWGKCSESLCEYYLEGAKWVSAGGMSAKAYVKGTRAYTWIAGIDVVEHYSKSPILTKGGRYLARTLGSYKAYAVFAATKTNLVANVASAVGLAIDGANSYCQE